MIEPIQINKNKVLTPSNIPDNFNLVFKKESSKTPIISNKFQL